METRAQALRRPVIPRHPRENGEKAVIHFNQSPWIPAFAGMTSAKIHRFAVPDAPKYGGAANAAPRRPGTDSPSATLAPRRANSRRFGTLRAAYSIRPITIFWTSLVPS